MKRIFLLIIPVIMGLVVFFTSLYFLSQSANGNGALQVTAIPDSNVYVNGKFIGKTPLCKCEGKDMLATGDYTIKLVPLSGDNLSAYEDHITIAKGILTVVDRVFGVGEYATGSIITLIPLQDKKAVQLFVASFPPGADVKVDGNDSGNTPLLLKTLTESDHDVLLTKNGYKDKTVHIHTVAGFQLQALITLGLLQQNATPSAVPSSGPTPSGTKVTILDTPTGFLRVRAEPTLNASETAQVKPGNSFNFVAEQDGWYEITLSDGTNGWVNAQYAKKQ